MFEHGEPATSTREAPTNALADINAAISSALGTPFFRRNVREGWDKNRVYCGPFNGLKSHAGPPERALFSAE